MKILAVALLFLSLPILAASPSNLILRPGVARNPAVDRIYEKFGVAFAKLDAAAVADNYDDHAAYLGPDKEILRGRTPIVQEFASFFEQLRQKNGKATITFEVVERHVAKNFVYDVNYFTVTTNATQVMRGKAVNVFQKDKGGVWRMHVDCFSFVK